MTEEKTVEFSELTGKHMLDAVDFGEIEVFEIYGDAEYANTMSFRLDGVVYTAVEDPDDGYRSFLSSIIVDNREMNNVFEPIEVLIIEQNKDLLEFIDAVTTKKVLEVGTDRSDDWYPYFVSSFSPENMSINAQVVSQEVNDFIDDVYWEINKRLKHRKYKTNDAATRLAVHSELIEYMKENQAKFSLYDFNVICNESNNPPNSLDNNNLTVDTFIKPICNMGYFRITNRMQDGKPSVIFTTGELSYDKGVLADGLHADIEGDYRIFTPSSLDIFVNDELRYEYDKDSEFAVLNLKIGDVVTYKPRLLGDFDSDV